MVQPTFVRNRLAATQQATTWNVSLNVPPSASSTAGVTLAPQTGLRTWTTTITLGYVSSIDRGTPVPTLLTTHTTVTVYVTMTSTLSETEDDTLTSV